MSGIAIVGTGPTGIYTFFRLLEALDAGAIALFGKGTKTGIGMPYSPETSSRTMLANFASIEIPAVGSTYIDWLNDQPRDRLVPYGVDSDELDERQFTPRLLLAESFRDKLLDLVDQARCEGRKVDIHEKTDVADILPRDEGLFLRTADNAIEGPFGHVIVATGHDFPGPDEATRRYFPNPWSGLIEADVPAVRVGIMGTSLSSIDAAMAVAGQHGRFRRKNGALAFQTDTQDLHLTLVSWDGVLAEADFYCPIACQPLLVVTDAAMADCVGHSRPLDAFFELFRAELTLADPNYAEQINPTTLTADSFADAYFAARPACRPKRGARRPEGPSDRSNQGRHEHQAARRHRRGRSSDPVLHDCRPGQRLHWYRSPAGQPPQGRMAAGRPRL